jgi:inner membrane protein
MAPAMALLAVLVVRLAGRKPIAWKMDYLVSLAGVASHLALDFTNVYGIRLLLPFSPRWLRLDVTSVVDLWIWAALLLSVIAPALSRLIGAEIGERRQPGRLAAALALAFLAVYSGARFVIHRRAVEILDSRIYNGAAPRRVAAFPSAWNPFAWQGLVEGEGSYTVFNLDVGQPFDPTEGRVFYQAQDTDIDAAAMDAARQTKVFRDFLAFSQFPLWTVVPVSDPSPGVRVEVHDMRFGAPGRGGFTAVAIIDNQMRVVRAWFKFL